MAGMKHVAILTLALAVASAGVAMANPQRTYRLSDQQLTDLVNRIGADRDAFQASFERAIDRSQADDSLGRAEINQAVRDFRLSTDRLRDRVNRRQSTNVDVEDVLRHGASIDSFMQRYQLSTQAERDWQVLRGDLGGLARAYGVAWNWGETGYMPAEPGPGLYHGLTGTFQLESNRGDDPRRAAELAARAAPPAQRQRVYQSLLTRLEAPEQIAIERNENSVTMASTRGRRVTLEADGMDHVERWSADRTMNTRASLEGERLVVATTGSRGSGFTVIFEPMENGRSLQVTRTIDDEGLRRPVTVRSSYRRLSDEARWDIDAGGGPDPYDRAGAPAGDAVVPDGTLIVAVLDNALSTRNSREGDRYTLTARSPSEYEGAVIEGFVSTVNESQRLAGRAGMTLNLRSIRLRDGNSYPFDGVIEDIRTPDGETIRVDREGTVDTHDNSQIQRTVERGAIGAALGAIIGAVAGGGKGAAIGAVIGAGGGAGTVMVEGRDRLDLQRGTEVTITSGDRRYRR